MSCQRCEKTSTRICKDCKTVDYCSKECQLEDWNTHKTTCVYYRYVNIDDHVILIFNSIGCKCMDRAFKTLIYEITIQNGSFYHLCSCFCSEENAKRFTEKTTSLDMNEDQYKFRIQALALLFNVTVYTLCDQRL